MQEPTFTPAALSPEEFARRALANVGLCDGATEAAAVPVACRP